MRGPRPLDPRRGIGGRAGRQAIAGALAALLALFSSGCQGNDPDDDSGTLHVLVGTPSNEALTAESVATDLGEFKTLIDGFRELHPRVTLTFAIFQESHLESELQRRNAAGLAPDLVMLTAARAVHLEKQHLLRPVTIPAQDLQQLEMQGLTRVALGNRLYAGVPVLQEPQLACFNRSRLPDPPQTVEELLAMAHRGAAFGLAVDPAHLFWSAGALGAGPAVLAALEHQPLSPQDRTRIINWLGWLQTRNLQQEISFLPDKDHLVNQLARKQLDWIPCRCGNIALLRRHLGDRLGVAPLPGGPGGAASPITRQLVWGFGVNSSPRQQQLADQLVRFSINPLTQRTVTLTTLAVLPANRLALPSAGTSSVVDVLLQSQKMGMTGHRFSRLTAEDSQRLGALRALLVGVIFGELTPEQATDRLIRWGGSER